MKKKLIVAAFSMAAISVNAQTWTADAVHSNVAFIITHMGISDFIGNFTKFDAKITSSKEDFSDAKVELNAETSSINTANEGRDKHLKSADFFDAEKNPKITFVSSSFKKGAGKNMYSVTGELTMHGITKTVTFEATYKGKTTNPYSKKETSAFHIHGSIKRSDFQIAPTMTNDMISDEVKLSANIEFVKE